MFLGVTSAVLCTVTSLELTYDRRIFMLIMLISAILFYGLFTVLETFPRGKLYGVGGITLFAIFVIIRFFAQIVKGTLTIVNNFLKGFMNFTGSDVSLIQQKTSSDASVKFCTTLVVVMVGIYLVALISAFFYRKRRSYVFLVATIPFILLPLLVGRVGYFAHIFTYLIVAVSIFGTRHLRTDATDRYMRQKLSIVLMAVGLGAGAFSWLFIPPERYENNMGRIEQVKNTVVALTSWEKEDIFSWVKAYFNDDAIDYGRVGKKDGVSYTGETLLKLSGDVNEKHGLYLRGYVGDRYSKNRWKSLGSDEEFQKDLQELNKLGIGPDSWHMKLRNELGESQSYSGGDIWQSGTLRIRNLAFGYGNYVVPYLPTSPFKMKENGRTTIDTLGIDYIVEYFAIYPYVMRKDVLTQQYSIGTATTWTGNNQVEREQLKEFAEKYYLATPDSVEDICNDFKQYLSENGDLYQKYQNGKVQENELIAAVKQYIAMDTTYTLMPGKTPSGKDTVEYFLKENKKGYCTYYATAAAVLLRSVGIPTRYVEGMYVSKEELAQGVESGQEIQVKDEDAHAWIEVFDDYYGFVPVEVTPGVGEDDLEQKTEQSDSQSQSPDHSNDAKDQEGEDLNDRTDPSAGEQATPTPSVTQEPEESMIFDDIDGNEDPSDEGGLGQSKGKRALGIIIEVLVVILVIAAVLEIQRRLRRFLFKRTLKSVRIRQKIRMLHHHLMPVLLEKKAVYRGQSMAEYTQEIAQAMKMDEDSVYVYVEYVYRGRFGPDDITEEEMEEFRYLYEKMKNRIYADTKWMKKLYYLYIMVL